MKEKACTICGEIKSLDNFYSQKKYSKKRGNYIYYNPECKECRVEMSITWQKANKDKRKEHLTKINASAKKKEMLRKSNKKRVKSGEMDKWIQNNPEKVKGYRRKSELKKHKLTKTEWNKCKEYFEQSCAYCGLHISKHFIKYDGVLRQTDFHKEHADHKGNNDISNCVPSCRDCNCNKWAKHFLDWYTIENPVFDAKRLNKINNWLNGDYKLLTLSQSSINE